MLKRWIWIYIFAAAITLVMIIGTERAVTVISEVGNVQRENCIILDAGHGEPDGGATSCTGVLESSLNLEIVLRLEDMFHLLGYNTLLIRRTDMSIYTQGESIAQKKISDLKERVRIVNEAQGAILISIHQNTFSDERYSGPQVFYASTAGSEALAKEVQDALVQSLAPECNRVSKQSTGIYLMEKIKCTGVLIECGFLSNIQEEAKLRTPEYQKKLCCGIVSAVSGFLSNA